MVYTVHIAGVFINDIVVMADSLRSHFSGLRMLLQFPIVGDDSLENFPFFSRALLIRLSSKLCLSCSLDALFVLVILLTNK